MKCGPFASSDEKPSFHTLDKPPKSLADQLVQPPAAKFSKLHKQNIHTRHDSKCPEMEEDWIESSNESFAGSVAAEDRAAALIKESAALRAVVEDYADYLLNSAKRVSQSSCAVRVEYEGEYNKLSLLVDKLIVIIREYKDTMARQFQAEMVSQQHELAIENTEISHKIIQTATIKEEVTKAGKEAAKYSEEQKCTAADKTEFKGIKERFFELTSEFEKILKFRPRSSLSRREALLNPSAVVHIFNSFSIREEARTESLQLGRDLELMSLCEKLKEIKRPLIAFLAAGEHDSQPGKGRTCVVSKYNMQLQSVQTNSLTFGGEIELEDCEAVTHPSGTSLYLVSGGQVAVYDSANGVILRKASNLACVGVKKSAVAAQDHYIYVIGGTKDGKALGSVNRFNVVTEKWSQLASLHTERYNAAACTLTEETVCVAGGENESSPALDSIEVLNVRSNVWELCVVSLKVPRRGLNLASLERNKIIVCGGVGIGKELVGATEEIDLTRNKAVTLSGPRSPRRDAKAFTLGGTLYIMGGRTEGAKEECAGERYNRRENRWEPVGGADGKVLLGTVCPAGLLYE